MNDKLSPVLAKLMGLFLLGLIRTLTGAQARWLGCPPKAEQRIYFANHQSHADLVLMWAALPEELRSITRPIAAKDYWTKTAIRRYIARQFNALLIDREEIKVHQSPVDLMIREMSYTHSLIVFPEGGRNPGEEMQEFKSGLYYLSKKRPDLELMPVYIDNLNRVLPRGEFLPVPLLSCITIGPPIWLEPKEPKADFLKRARDAVRRLKDV